MGLSNNYLICYNLLLLLLLLCSDITFTRKMVRPATCPNKTTPEFQIEKKPLKVRNRYAIIRMHIAQPTGQNNFTRCEIDKKEKTTQKFHPFWNRSTFYARTAKYLLTIFFLFWPFSQNQISDSSISSWPKKPEKQKYLAKYRTRWKTYQIYSLSRKNKQTNNFEWNKSQLLSIVHVERLHRYCIRMDRIWRLLRFRFD